MLGNCDLLLSGSLEPSPAGVRRMPFIPAQLAWCRERLSVESAAILRDLPLVLRFPGTGRAGELLVCHASPRDTRPVCAPEAPDAVWEAVMGPFEGGAVAFGHGHVPATRRIDGKLYVNVAHCGLGCPDHVGYTALTCTSRGWRAERRPVAHDPDAEAAYARAVGFPGAEEDTGF